MANKSKSESIGMSEVKSFAKLLESEMVKVFVGFKKKKYMISKHLLLSSSSNFKCSIKHDDHQPGWYTMLLPDLEPVIFDIFVLWLYKTISLSSESDIYPHFENQELLDIYKFAADFQIVQLQNESMDAFQDNVGCGATYLEKVDIDKIAHHLESEAHSSFVAAFLNWENAAKKGMEAKYLAELLTNQKALEDYLTYSLKFRDPDAINSSPGLRGKSDFYHICKFHTHSDGKECTSQKTMFA